MPARGDDDRGQPAGEDDVVAAVDRSMDEPQFVIADVSADGAWIATPTSEAVLLEANR